MEELGKDMVKHCAGLPLAINVLGGILATKTTLYEWQKASENVKRYLERGKDVLALSYDALPPHLKPCFLYLSHFPEDDEIPVDRLIQLWVADGIILPTARGKGNGGEEILEDVAESYLVELAERCMIQVGEIDATLKMKTCRMHDLMRELCLSKAEQANFLCIIDHSLHKESSPSVIPTARRIVARKCYPSCIKSSNLRSILFFGHVDASYEALLPLSKYLDEHDEDDSILFRTAIYGMGVVESCRAQGFWTDIINGFKLLRVLDFEGETGMGGFKLPDALGDLIHLRFLSLRGFLFIWPKIPSSLGNLRCLQTLDLRVDHDFVFSIFVPDVLWRLEELRHLYLPEKCKRKTKLKLHTLRHLQTLVNFNTKYSNAADLSSLINLTELEIRKWSSNAIDDLDGKYPIVRSKRIRSLCIRRYKRTDTRNGALLISSCSTICELSLCTDIGELPEYHHFSSSIAYMHLSWCKLGEDPMPLLEKLPNLRILEIQDEAFIGKKMVCSENGFPKLDSLCLISLWSLEEWKVDKGAMPTLRYLKIEYCKNLKMLPDELSSITTLRQLEFMHMPESFEEGEEAFKEEDFEEGEDFNLLSNM